MKRIGVRTAVVYFVVGLFVILSGIYVFRLVRFGRNWVTYPINRHIYTNGKLTNSGTVTDSGDIVLAETSDGVRSYSSDSSVRKATIHALGDLRGNISGGVQSVFLPELTGYNLVNGIFSPDGQGNNIKLTLDSELCVTAMNALGNYSGTIAVYNYKTGEMICMVSTPTYDPTKEVTQAQLDKSIYLNRCLFGKYTPGSVFKLVTAECAIENISDIDDYTVECDGGCYVDGEWVDCSGNHGKVNLKEALAESCNAYFAQLTVRLGKDKMFETAEKLGFNKSFSLEGTATAKGSYKSEYKSLVNFAWSGIGQSTVLANPYQMLIFTGAIANGGSTIQPYEIDSITSSLNLPSSLRIHKKISLMNEDTANKLSDFMRNNVESKYGEWRFKGLDFCAKTGTAQADDSEATSWIVGFSRRDDKPYAIVVAVEKGGYGISKAGSIANKVMQAAKTVK